MNAVEVEPVRIAADQVFTNAIVDAVAPHMSRKAVAPHMSRN
jgi:hypothetical protein